MALDKTLTIKQRRVDIYLPTLETKANWNEAAKKRGLSLSDFVFQTMEMSLHEDLLDESPALPAELQDELSHLRRDRDRLSKRVEELEVLLSRAEDDLAQYRAQHIIGPEPIKRLDPRLIRILSEARGRDGRYRVVDAAEISRQLRVNPKNAAEVQAMARQLEALEVHEVVKRSGKGWMWIGKD